MTISLSSRRVIVPPYWGVPNLSHQCAAVVPVVTGVEVVTGFVVVGVTAVVFVVVVWVGAAVGVVVDDKVVVLQDASNIAAAIRKLKLSRKKYLFDIFYLQLLSSLSYPAFYQPCSLMSIHNSNVN